MHQQQAIGRADEAALVQRYEVQMAAAGSDPAAQRRTLVPLIREFAATMRREAEAKLVADGQGTGCARALSDAQDLLIRVLFTLGGRVYKAHNPSAAERIAVVAVGGYGRGTLAPGSDIDLLFLLPYKQTAWGESVAEFILYLLWDSGFKVWRGPTARSRRRCSKRAICAAIADSMRSSTSVIAARSSRR
jgi:[protein-PII] uridylyltransferase